MSASSAFPPASSSSADVGRLYSELRAPSANGSWNRVVLSRISSTNTLGKRVASSYLNQGCAPLPTVLMAIEQDGGRGRLGRHWTSPPGGIYATLIVPHDPQVSLSMLPLKVSVALCRELDQIIGPPCRLKWPNDLIADGRKLGGVLIETIGRGENVAVVVGFGINYADGLTELVSDSTSVLDLALQAPGLGDLASRLIDATAGTMTEGSNMAEVIEEYSSWSLHRRGQRMSCRTPLETCTGTFAGFDELGFIRLKTDGGERTFSAGDLIEANEVERHV